MTLEPALANTRGIVDPGSVATVNEKQGVNLFTPHELLTPLGVMHDDSDRTAIMDSDVAV